MHRAKCRSRDISELRLEVVKEQQNERSIKVLSNVEQMR